MAFRSIAGICQFDDSRAQRWVTVLGLVVSLGLPNCGGPTSPTESDWTRTAKQLTGVAGGGGGSGVGAAAGHEAGGSARNPPTAGWPGNETTNHQAIARDARLSEVKIDPPGADSGFEFVELGGQAGTSLEGHWIVTLEGDSESNRGQVDTVIDLSDCSGKRCEFDPMGLLLLISEPSGIGPVDGASLRITSEIARGGLENGTTSLLLLRSTIAPKPGDDWDSNDDGILEIPNGVSIQDSIAWTDGDATDARYSYSVLGPKPKPHAILSCFDETGTRTWRYGQLLGEGASMVFDVAHSVPEGLGSLVLTPSAPNDCMAPLPNGTGPDPLGGAGRGSIQTIETPAAGCGSSNSSSGSAVQTIGADGIVAPVVDGAPDGSRETSNPVTRDAIADSVGGRGGQAVASVPPSVAGRLGIGTGSIPGSVLESPTLRSTGGAGTDLPVSVQGCAAGQVMRITARAGAHSGTSGWWSPTPITPSSGASSRALQPASGGSRNVASSQETGAIPPDMPSACETTRRPLGRPRSTWLVWLAGLLWVGTARRLARDRSERNFVGRDH